MSEPLWRRVLRLYGPDPRADVRDEFAFHLEERTEALMAKGMPEAAARELARRQLGDLARAAAARPARRGLLAGRYAPVPRLGPGGRGHHRPGHRREHRRLQSLERSAPSAPRCRPS